MRVDLTINEVGKTWQFGNEQVWSVKSNGKTFSFYSPHKPVVGSYIPCMVEERTGATKDGKAITYRDARPIPKEELLRMDDNVPNFQTPSNQAEKPSSAEASGGRPPELPQDTPEWAKPGPKPTLAGVDVIMSRVFKGYAVGLKELGVEFKDIVNPLESISSTINTVIMAYAPRDHGPLIVEPALIPDEVQRAYQAAADGQWPGKE